MRLQFPKVNDPLHDKQPVDPVQVSGEVGSICPWEVTEDLPVREFLPEMEECLEEFGEA